MSVLTTLPEQLYDAGAFKGFEAGSRFTIENARALAWMCQLAYETDDREKVQRILQTWGGELVEHGIIVQSLKIHGLPIGDSRCILSSFPSAIVLAFAGTDPLSLANWITDFDTVFSPQNTAMGYQNAVDLVWPALRQLLLTEINPRSSLLVVGHSLGGALAAVVAYQACKEGIRDVKAVYTFGMPRVGGDTFRSEYHEVLGLTTYRLVYGNDIVPTVAPPELGYRHIGRYFSAVHDQRFSAEKLSPDDFSDMPAFLPVIATELLSKFQDRLPSIAPISTRMRIAGAVLAGFPVSSGRSDLTGILIEILPPQLRDHILDRYIAALI
jgi:triacylglycerol lipase